MLVYRGLLSYVNALCLGIEFLCNIKMVFLSSSQTLGRTLTPNAVWSQFFKADSSLMPGWGVCTQVRSLHCLVGHVPYTCNVQTRSGYLPHSRSPKCIPTLPGGHLPLGQSGVGPMPGNMGLWDRWGPVQCWCRVGRAGRMWRERTGSGQGGLVVQGS